MFPAMSNFLAKDLDILRVKLFDVLIVVRGLGCQSAFLQQRDNVVELVLRRVCFNLFKKCMLRNTSQRVDDSLHRSVFAG